MLYWLGDLLLQFSDGPHRLFTSHLSLATIGLAICAISCWWILPKSIALLPSDQGRDFTPGEGKAAKGKPTSAGAFFIPLCIGSAFMVCPIDPKMIMIFGLALIACLFGYLDDAARKGWGEYSKAIIDLLISFAAAYLLCDGESTSIWLPFTKQTVHISAMVYIAVGTLLLWIAINATNCTDGIDGLSASLLLLAFLFLAVILYLVVGHREVSRYLILPHSAEAAHWSLLSFCLIGTLLGYLWHNAYPSAVLMGDAGSRPLGFLLGVLVLATGNPVLLFVVAGVVLVNGGTGLIKVALLRFFKIGIFKNIRFPLHDHCRVKFDWSCPQVLLRFMILQAVLTPVLIVLVLKIR